MPLLKSAIKKMKQDKKKAKINKKRIQMYSKQIQKVKKTKNKDDALKAYSFIDKARNKKLIHKNKASRLKSFVARIISK
jgi:small subunit ribosomal protein S20